MSDVQETGAGILAAVWVPISGMSITGAS